MLSFCLKTIDYSRESNCFHSYLLTGRCYKVEICAILLPFPMEFYFAKSFWFKLKTVTSIVQSFECGHKIITARVPLNFLLYSY